MNYRNKTIIIFLIGLLIIWKAFEYYNVEIESDEEDNNSHLDKLVPHKEQSSDALEKVTVTVYYEVLCSDSRNFVLRQLLPTYLQLSRYIVLDLVPYGKAKTIEKPDGKLVFRCQHGEIECLGNKLHGCMINVVKDPLLVLQMVACMIDDNILPFDAAEKCSRKNNVNYDAIVDCTNSFHGSELLKEFGIQTNKVHPSFIPTVELNGEMNFPLSEILKDLKKQVCNTFTVRKPKECL